eukprot:CAMPEP_0119356958 /NCGR_PEP_ID=MMETSP1334-20130426/5446_1 /TAXON_ID=127549 /ORGANISM="Calcidiscus leptoporus, Strain RCC1130" /LENGTH=86 /DNA_ID=CAMNT_0007371093 /DNA_START=100 /DNA_END=360 /DNA_ORIENTATION=-
MALAGDNAYVQQAPPVERGGFIRVLVPAGCAGGEEMTVFKGAIVTVPKGLRAGDCFLYDPATGQTLKEPVNVPRRVLDTLILCSVQ